MKKKREFDKIAVIIADIYCVLTTDRHFAKYVKCINSSKPKKREDSVTIMLLSQRGNRGPVRSSDFPEVMMYLVNGRVRLRLRPSGSSGQLLTLYSKVFD